jgi:hypothetical protein
MLLAFLPLYILDGMFEVCVGGMHMWEVPKEPVVIVMEEEPQESTLAA